MNHDMNLVFIHGSGCSHHVWSHQVSFFQNSVAVDLPGHPEGDALLSVTAMSQWVLTTLEKQNLDNVVLVGHSLGGAVVLQAALAHSHRVKALVLIGSGSRLKVLPQFLSALTEIVEKKGPLPEFLLTPNQGIDELLRTQINTAMKENGSAVMLTDFLACNDFDVMNELSNITIPVQLIVGSEDVMTPVKYSRFLNEQLPNASLSVVDGATHMVFAEQPDSVNQCIQRFINSISN